MPYYNLVGYGGFDQDSNGDGLADGWVLYSGYDLIKKLDSEIYKVGGCSQYLKSPAPQQGFWYRIQPFSMINGHKYYIRGSAYVKDFVSTSNNNIVSIRIYSGTIFKFLVVIARSDPASTPLNVWTTSSGIHTADGTEDSFNYLMGGTSTNLQSFEANFDGFMLIDLTEEFGAGNEPTKEWCDANIPDDPQFKTDWNASSYYNSSDLNRVNQAIAWLSSRLDTYGYNSKIPTSIKLDYLRTDFPYVADINLVRQRVLDLISSFNSTGGPPIIVNNDAIQLFNYSHANAIEQNLKALYDLLVLMEQSFKKCGTIKAGQNIFI